MAYFKHKYVMGGNMSRKVVVNGKKSDWYESATFVLKDTTQGCQYPRDLENYAEELIENYLKKGGRSHQNTDSYKWIDNFFFISIGILIFISIIGLIF